MTDSLPQEKQEDDLYRRVLADDGDHRQKCGRLAKELGLSKRRIVGMVDRAAKRDSWRIAGLEPPRPGQVAYTLGKGGHLRAEKYDSEGNGHPIEVRPPRASDMGYSPSEYKDTTPPLRSREYPVKTGQYGRPGQKATFEHCAVCEDPIPNGRRAGSSTCSDRCVNARKRELNGDPTVRATITWLRDPPACKGCGKSLRAKRVGTTYHNARCRRRAQRLNARAA